MMRTVSGDHVLLAHLLQGSVAVEPSQRVTYTSFLGSVGNSGRSTVAHLHMHVQEAAKRRLGAAAFESGRRLRCPRCSGWLDEADRPSRAVQSSRGMM